MIKNIFFFVFISLLFISCKKEFFGEGTGGQLAFSNDSIIFDTVFTSVGSITKTFKVFNQNNYPVKINDIELVNQNNLSVYRINIDGEPIEDFSSTTIPPNDSIFMFVEATINPNSGNPLPFLVSDSIRFSTDTFIQYVELVAYGQNANFHLAEPQDIIIITTNNDTIIPSYYSIDQNTTWTNDLPHVVYGYVIIEPGAELTIEAGSNIYFHNNSGIIVGNPLFTDNNGGKISVLGELGNEVSFQGDRLDEYYKYAPGQWDKIWISSGSFDNTINYAIIKNSTIGVQADTLGSNTIPTLRISNTIIDNASDIGIFAQGSSVLAQNNLISNSGRYSLVLNIGGNYDFNHCTFADFHQFGNRSTPSILINNYYEDINSNIQARDLDNATFTNCIFSGSLVNELNLQEDLGAEFNYMFDHCLLKLHPDSSLSSLNQSNSIKIDSDFNLFEDVQNGDFQLSTNSTAINKGKLTNNLTDILGANRDQSPDIGAYEKVN